MIDVSELITDPDFAESYQVERSTGFFDEGGFTESLNVFDNYGSVQPTDTKDLEQVAEGDRISGSITFYSVIPLFVTRNKSEKGNSDKLIFNGERYKIVKLLDFMSNGGYQKAIAVSIAGD